MYISILLILCKIGPWPTRSTVLNTLCQTLRVGKEFGSDVSGLGVGKISFSEEDSCANDLLIKYSQKNKTTIVRGWGNMDLKAQANAHLQQSQSSGCSLTLQKTLEGKKSFQSEARVLAITPRKLKLPGTSFRLLSLEQSCCGSLRLLERRAFTGGCQRQIGTSPGIWVEVQEGPVQEGPVQKAQRRGWRQRFRHTFILRLIIVRDGSERKRAAAQTGDDPNLGRRPRCCFWGLSSNCEPP